MAIEPTVGSADSMAECTAVRDRSSVRDRSPREPSL